MSKVEKTIESTARVLAALSSKDGGPSKSFQLLIRQIGETKTKHEEDRIIRREAVFLKERVGAPDTTARQMREYLIRLVYCEMLGLECPWGYIHAVKLTQSSSIMDKRIGYLAVSLFLHENHELNMLLVNTLQKDLKSSNMLEVSMALIIICKLIGAEMIPPLLPLVQDKLLHPKELVRKKAVMVMYRFHTLSPGIVSHLENDFRRALSDQDPGVMEAALLLFHELIKGDPSQYKDLTSSFINILEQVITRKLPSEFNYHGVPAPWIQIRLLRILALLGYDDHGTSEQIYDVLERTLGSAECTSNIGQAITYECIRTVTTIYPKAVLIEKAAKAIVRFVTAPNHNWKYLGITALSSLVQVNAKYAAQHQMVVIDCLDDPDETLKRKTLDLLYKMTNPLNVEVITEKLIGYLRQTRDEYNRSDLVGKITQLAERFAPSNQWFIQTMNAVFELGGNLVRREVAHNLMRLIAEGTDDEETDAELRLDAVSSYIALLDKPNIPDILVKIICWVVGEYAYLLEELETEEILESVTELLNRRFEDAETHGWAISAVTKLVSQLGHLPDSVQSQLALYLTSTDTDIQQRCSELLELSHDLGKMQVVLPIDSSCEDLEVDSSLSFLDEFVSEALARGASAYKPPHLRAAVPQQRVKQTSSQEPEIKYKPYAPPSRYPPPSIVTPTPAPQESHDTLTTATITPSPGRVSITPPPSPQMETRKPSDYSITPSDTIRTTRNGPWSKDGYRKPQTVIIQPTPPSPQPTEQSLTTEQSDGVRGDGRGGEGRQLSEEREKQLSPVQATIREPSPEERRKKELASALFGGTLTGPSRAPRPKQQRRQVQGGGGGGGGGGKTTPPSSRVEKKREQQVETDLLLDLQDIDFSQTSSTLPVVEPQQDGPSAADILAPIGGGLLTNLEIRSPDSNEASVPSGSKSLSDDLLGLFDGPLLTSSSASNSTALPPSSTASILTPLITSDISLLEPTSASIQPLVKEPQRSLVLTLFETPIWSIRVPSEYASFPIAPGWDNKDICHDANLRVTLTKVLKPDKLVVVLFLTNQKQGELLGVSLTVEPPSNMKACTGDGKEDLSLQATLSGFGSITHVIVLSPSSPAINMSLRGQVAYKDTMTTQRRLFFDTTVYVSDIIRPLQMTTQEFGKQWGSFSHEKKVKLQSSVRKPAEFMSIIKTSFNFHAIEVIGNEGIAAGTFLPNTTCLIHSKVSPSHLDFWVRTSSSLLAESIAKLAQLVIK